MEKKSSLRDSTPASVEVNSSLSRSSHRFFDNACKQLTKQGTMKRSKEGKVLTANTKKDPKVENPKQNYLNLVNGHGVPAPPLPALHSINSNMVSYIICLTAGGGLPLFTSKHSSAKTLPLPLLGALSVVHTFTESHGVSTLNSTTKDERIVCREYDSVVLMAIAPLNSCSDFHLYQLLDTIYRVMILFVGVKDVLQVRSVEKLTRDLRCCLEVIDRLRVSHFETNCDSPLVGDLVQAADSMLCQESAYLNTVLDAFVQSASSTCGCLFANGKVVTATRDWLTLDCSTMAVIAFYLLTSPKVTCRDVPIFLPNSEDPIRLLVFRLITNINVCLLCGAEPTLTQLMKKIHRFWKDSHESLKSIQESEKRCFPSNVQLDSNILGFILVHPVEKKCMCSIYPHGEDTDDKQIAPNQRLILLRKYYSRTVTHLFLGKSSNENAVNHGLEPMFSHQCLETYTCSTDHKLYAHQNSTHQLFILFNSRIPTYCLRSAGVKLLEALTKSKHLKF